MSITTITISGTDYASYASVAEADAYLAVDPVRSVTWAALSADAKGSKLVAATRRLDLLIWQGERAGGDGIQAEQWPRTGVSYPDGTATSTTEVPQEVEDACILLAGSIAIKASVSGAGTSGSNVKRTKAGSAEVEFFRRNEGKPLQDETAFALVKSFTEAASSSTALGPLASGTDGESTFTDADAWGRTRGFP